MPDICLVYGTKIIKAYAMFVPVISKFKFLCARRRLLQVIS
jgi:hypothetical protein